MKLIKFILIPLLIFAVQTAIFGQETPVGKKFAEDFWKFLEEGRFVAAEGRLDSIKRREPNFDASKMEKALADAKNKKADNVAAGKSALRSKVNASTNLQELFQSRVIQADSSDTLESIKAEIAKYSQKADEVLAVNRADIERDLQKTLDSLKRDLINDVETNTKLIKRTNETTDPKGAEAFYYELLLRQSYWDTARRIFPDEAELKKAYDSISSSINKLGTAEQRAKNAEKNLNAKIDAERLPKAVLRDTKLEKWFEDTFKTQTAQRGNNYTFLKVNITANDFLIKRNELTGIILSRSHGAHIAFKKADGKCYHGLYGIVQQYVGGTFQGGKLSEDFALAEMRCENVNK